MTPDELREWSDTIRLLRNEDKELRVFGADEHKYELRPTLSESQLQEFEHQHDVKLPGDYRLFLQYVGEGNAGPYYGLFPLEVAAKYSRLSKPFFWTETFARHNKEQWPQTVPNFPTVPDMILVSPHEQQEWHERPGVLELADEGCGGSAFLVVKGDAYGTVWTEWCGYFWSDKLTFAAWYRRWIRELQDDVLPMLKREQVVKQVQLGMTKAEVMQICGGESSERESIFGNSMLSFAHLRTQFEFDDKNVLVRIVAHSL